MTRAQIFITGLVLALILGVGDFLYSSSEKKPSTSEAYILFGGDMMFDRTIRTTAEKKGGNYLFACLDPLLKKADMTVANLEGPITGNPSASRDSQPGDGNNFTFTFPTSTAALLAAHFVGIVNLGNNHITNFKTEGVKNTITILEKAGVAHFGDPVANNIVYRTFRGVKIAFIGFNEFVHPMHSSSSAEATTVSQIKEARGLGYLPVIYSHWGEEYKVATGREKMLAHEFIDAGAEMVVGSHPHIVQEHETYRGKYIYYSLGNLIFDQYWNDAVTHGLMLEVQFDTVGVVGVTEIPVVLNRSRTTCPVENKAVL